MDQNQNPNAMKWLFHFAGKKKGSYLLSVILALAGVGMYLWVYFVMADIVRALISGNQNQNYYIKKCILMAVLWILRYLFHSLSTFVSHRTTFAVLAGIRTALLNKLIRVPLGKVKDQSSGSYKNTICERVDSIETTLAHIVPEFTSNLTAAIILFIYMLVIDWRVGLWSLVTIPVAIVTFCVMMAKMPKYFPQTVEKTKILNDTAVEYINGIEVIKTFGQSKKSYGKFVKAAKDGADCFIDWMRACIFEMGFGMSVMPATLIGVLPAGVIYCMKGSLSSSDFIFLIILSFGVISPLIIIYGYMDDLSQLGVIMGEVADIMDLEDMGRPENPEITDELKDSIGLEITDKLKNIKNPDNASIILSDVHFSYKDKEVLHGINMEIKEGTVNALVGPSGSGKSTIAKLIASLWDVDSGSISLGGKDIRTLPMNIYNLYISYVSQDNYLFDMTVMENIRMGNPKASDDEVKNAARKCGCDEFIMSLENGYQTVCGAGGGHLSGGERQRISIARAVLKNAPIIILDEATSYTDPESEAVIQEALSGLTEGKTVIMIAHRLSTIKDADKIFVIKDGNVEESGTHEELLKKSKLYADMWKSHIAVRNEDIGNNDIKNNGIKNNDIKNNDIKNNDIKNNDIKIKESKKSDSKREEV